ncbi:MAG: hypothetical protein K2P81_14445 [Bacteriovoracaceae bacterium]|nr:hypothetical protein [Bacteriovoracaceae bacterium]
MKRTIGKIAIPKIDLKLISKAILAIFYIMAGLNHFINPEFYMKAMPPLLPYPHFLHLFSGILEIIAGIGLFTSYSRQSSFLIIAILVIVFPANIYVALNDGIPMGIPSSVAWIRLPFQLVFILWAWWHTKKDN